MNDLDIFYQRTDGNVLGDNTDRPAHDGTTIDRRTTLHINGITEADDGEYECVVRNLVDGGAVVLGRCRFTVVVTCKSIMIYTVYMYVKQCQMHQCICM